MFRAHETTFFSLLRTVSKEEHPEVSGLKGVWPTTGASRTRFCTNIGSRD